MPAFPTGLDTDIYGQHPLRQSMTTRQSYLHSKYIGGGKKTQLNSEK